MRVLDTETVAHPDLALWLDESDVKPDTRLKDPEKIAASKAAKLAERYAEAALKGATNRIIVIGDEGDGRDDTRLLLTEDAEREALSAFWTRWDNTADVIVGFNLKFDVDTMIMRSWLLGVRPSITEFNPYRPGRIIDLRTILSQGDKFAHGSLTWWCKRFGIVVPDDTDGSDVAAMWAAGNHAGILAHCRADLAKTRALYDRVFNGVNYEVF